MQNSRSHLQDILDIHPPVEPAQVIEPQTRHSSANVPTGPRPSEIARFSAVQPVKQSALRSRDQCRLAAIRSAIGKSRRVHEESQ